MQLKQHSFYEDLCDTTTGFLISLVATFVMFPILEIPTTSGQNLIIALFFTLIRVARSFVARRWFNDKV